MSGNRSIEIAFLGGASGIGASCTLVRVAGASFVVDCGVRYSGPSALPDLSQLAETPVDAILVTHAHMDHTGGLPVLAEACPGTPVFATPPTIDLVGILLRDSLRLMNSPERESEVPLYTEHQVDQLLQSMAPVKYHQPIRIGDVEVRWLPASHILGAAMIQMTTPQGTILFTGDYSVSAQQTVPALDRPTSRADLVISESTYGQRLHEDRNAAEERLLGQVREVVDRGGRVLIPAFALGRAQEILLILKRALRSGKLAEVPVFVDGMVRAVCDVYRNHEPFVSRQLAHEIRRTPHAFYTDAIQRIGRPEDRARVLDTAPCIIVASSGMLSGGPSQGYSRELVKNANDAILLTGYQDEESPGRALLELARSEGPKELKLGQETVPVACQFGAYGLSAHADRMQMVSFIQAMEPRSVVLVHGDTRAKETLAGSLRCDDVILARDGLTLHRSYPARVAGKRRAAPAVPSSEDLDIDRMRHLLGPAGGSPLRAADVAEAWAGQAVDRATAERLARMLESVGLVRRDDHRRDRLWVLGPQESDLFADEAALEEQLKQDNPKGRLLELCSRMRLDPPQTDLQPRGACYEANMSLLHDSRTLTSGPCQAFSKKTAEQLAARALLEKMSPRDKPRPAKKVTEDDASRLQSENPKGRLLEWCAKENVGLRSLAHHAIFVMDSQPKEPHSMKTRHHLTVLCLLALVAAAHQPGAARAENASLAERFSQTGAATDLLSANDWRPLPTAGERTAWDALPTDARDRILALGSEYAQRDVPGLPATLYLEFRRNGNRSRYQDVWMQRRAMLGGLALAECVEGKGRFLDALANVVWAICEESSWTWPAHISAQRAGSGLPDTTEPVVALFSAETASSLAWMVYLLEEQLDEVSPLICQRIRREIDQRILSPYLDRDDFGWMGLRSSGRPNNWNPWINSNVLAATLLLEEDRARREQLVGKILRCLDRFFVPYPSDGSCDEGPSYWGRAGASLFDNLELLYSATEGKFDVYDDPAVREIGRFIYRLHIAGDAFVCVGDCDVRSHVPWDLVFRYGQRIDDLQMQDFARSGHEHDGLWSESRGPWSLMRPLYALFNLSNLRSAMAQAPLLRDVWLGDPDLQLMAARDRPGTADGLYVAAWGGHNGQSHNHNDVGSFLVYLNGKPALIDVGRPTYTRQTFSRDRYKIWAMQSAYHNLPTVNGQMQQAGGRYAAREVSYHADDESACLELDLASAYPGAAGIESWIRTVRLVRGESVQVTDRFALGEASSDIVQHLITPCVVELMPDGTFRMHDAEAGTDLLVRYEPPQLRVSVETIEIQDEKLAELWGPELQRISLRAFQPQALGIWSLTMEPKQ